MLKAPFPWFGGKSRVSHIVWDRFGDVPNYVEPFFGSGAVLLGRPHPPGTETVNDKDAYVANFWRALAADPDEVAKYADWPVNEADLEARHHWLVSTGAERLERMRMDPDAYDAKVAGWWVWGQCAWIGSGWCAGAVLSDCTGVHRKRPHLGNGGKGVHRQGPDDLKEYFAGLAARLRRVRVAVGEWDRILGDSGTIKHGVTGVFLDPPYSHDERDAEIYSVESDVSHLVRQWAIDAGSNPLFRIALCGYEGEHQMPPNWDCVAWKAPGGYGSRADNQARQNAGRERIWFSPHCLGSSQPLLWDEVSQ